MEQTTILVTGGAGFIGTHVVVELMAAGYRPVVLDNFSNSRPQALSRVAQIAGQSVEHVAGDIRSPDTLDKLLERLRARGTPVSCVVHLAGCKAVGESVRDPLKYYDVNVGGAANLLHSMRRFGIDRMVFSSSATVYGTPTELPIREHHSLAPTNPYGRSKLVAENLIADVCAAEPGLGALALRYFNPIGAHPSGLIGECPAAEPDNLFPYITQVAIGTRARLTIFGNDYPTVDGTGVRDYLHVVDLARGHVHAVEYVLEQPPGMRAINLGTGRGTSVLELLHCFERVTGMTVEHAVAQRRPGDVAAMWADPGRAEQELGWRARHSLDDMCGHGWHWQQANPRGYPEGLGIAAGNLTEPVSPPLSEMVA